MIGEERKFLLSLSFFFFFLSDVHLSQGAWGWGEWILIEVELSFELQIVSHCDFLVFVLD